jgi:hypothetical protein
VRTSKTLVLAAAAVATTTVAAVTVAGLQTGPALAAAAHPAAARQDLPSYSVRTILNGAHLSHVNSKTGKKEALTKPDDITQYGGNLYTAFQNGVGPQGQPAPDGNRDSTVVEFTKGGSVVAQWDLTGKVDGLTANPGTGDVIATVNEDRYSSLYDITGGTVVHYRYNTVLPHHGGTDAISFYKGQMLISASAPGTTGAAAPNAAYPAVYVVTLNPATHVATVKPYFGDEASARQANLHPDLGAGTKLALTDPDSSEIVPSSAPRFRGDFMLNSQGDLELIFSSAPSSLWVLKLSQSIDDTAWATSWGSTLYATDNGADTVDAVDSHLFWPGIALVAVTPCNANSAPATCPAPGYPANYLGRLDMFTGQITRVALRGVLHPQGLIFVGGSAPSYSNNPPLG